MTEKTIRQTLWEEAAGFATIKAAVFTTFNFHPEFFEDNVLPALFDIDDGREARRRIQVNHRLLRTEVCTLYDASTRPKGGGNYRYQRVGVFRPGGFFHPKLMILAGTHQDDGRPWIYLTAASANLTLSGWGKNQEVIGEAWIGNNQQTLFGEVRDALIWLRENGAGRAHTSTPAIDQCLAIMKSMGGGSSNVASTNASFYFSPLHDDGFWPFLQANQTAKWDDILALSPYWGEVAENTRLANSCTVRLAPAMLDDGNYGLGRNGLPEGAGLELLKLARLENNRFWHTKTYVLTRGDRIRVGVGSANFTGAGLKGGANGNVEAMLVFDVDASDQDKFLPELVPLPMDDPRIPQQNTDEGPEPAELEITVAFDWKARKYLIYFTPAEDPDSGDYRLVLPGCEPMPLDGENGVQTIPDAKGPVSGSSFCLRYIRAGSVMVFDGLINEINVDFGDKPYFRPLSLLEILESWRLPADSPPMPKGDSLDDDTDPDAGSGPGGGDAPAAQFDVLNFYEMYRSFYALRARMDEAVREKNIECLRGFLVTRPDSVYRVAKQAGEDSKEHPMPRFLVLLECREIMTKYCKNFSGLDKKFQCDTREWVNQVRAIVKSLPWPSQTDLPSSAALSWFETELNQAWRT
jgi:hypothetical protein